MRQQININVLKPHPKNNEFFDDLNGEEFERLKNSIKDEKIYTDILVSPDMTIISGHQRVRAAKELGMTLVPIKIDDDLQDENSKLRALISNNFGRRKNDPAKDRKALATYVELKGYGQGRPEKGANLACFSLDEIAKGLNMSKRNLQRALRIERNLTDSMKELLDTGEITKTFASDTIASLTEEEQEELISKLDVTKKYTQKQIEKYIAEMKSPDSDNQELLEQYNVLKTEKENLESLNESLEEAKKLSDDIANKYKKNSDEYDRLKNDITDMGLNPNGEYNIYLAIKEISKLNKEIQKFLLNKLAPTKYQDYIFVVQENERIKENFLNTLNLVKEWYCSMLSYIGEDVEEEYVSENIIDMEEN
jgi:ParB-like chromosome segregation protein Spo0J